MKHWSKFISILDQLWMRIGLQVGPHKAPSGAANSDSGRAPEIRALQARKQSIVTQITSRSRYGPSGRSMFDRIWDVFEWSMVTGWLKVDACILWYIWWYMMYIWWFMINIWWYKISIRSYMIYIRWYMIVIWFYMCLHVFWLILIFFM